MEAFTAEELAEIVRELGLPAEIEIDDDQSSRINVITDDVEWSVMVMASSPFGKVVTYLVTFSDCLFVFDCAYVDILIIDITSSSAIFFMIFIFNVFN